MTTTKPKLSFFGVLAVAGTLSFLCAAVITVADVILRQQGDGIFGVVDYVQLFVITGAFLAMPYTFATQGHVRVELVLDLLPRRAKALLTLAATLIALAFVTALVWYNLQGTLNVIDRGDISMNVGLPLGFYHIAMVSGLALSIIAIFVVLVRMARAIAGSDDK